MTKTTTISDAFYEFVYFVGTEYPEVWQKFCKKHHQEVANKSHHRKMEIGDLYAGI